MAVARGTFPVQLRPVPGEPAGMGRFELDKAFEGDLSGTSRGMMLSAGDPSSGSAGYVVIELVDAEIDGRTGGFALQHSGTMRPDGQDLRIIVTPGSGTGDFVGIEGSFEITVADDGTHHYVLDHSV